MVVLLIALVGIAFVVMVGVAAKPPRTDRRRMPR